MLLLNRVTVGWKGGRRWRRCLSLSSLLLLLKMMMRRRIEVSISYFFCPIRPVHPSSWLLWQQYLSVSRLKLIPLQEWRRELKSSGIRCLSRWSSKEGEAEWMSLTKTFYPFIPFRSFIRVAKGTPVAVSWVIFVPSSSSSFLVAVVFVSRSEGRSITTSSLIPRIPDSIEDDQLSTHPHPQKDADPVCEEQWRSSRKLDRKRKLPLFEYWYPRQLFTDISLFNPYRTCSSASKTIGLWQ